MFENEYKMNKSLTREYVIQVLSMKTIIPGLVIFVVGLFLFLAEKNALGYVMLTSSIIGLFCAVVTPIMMINNLESASKRINNGNIEKTHIEFGNNIVMDEGKAHLEFEYSQIIKIVETSNFIVLKLGDSSAILVHKKGFTKGTLEEFINFINDKVEKRL